MLKRFISSFRSVNPTQLILELFIVFLGVYLAFLLSGFQERSQRMDDRKKVLELLDIGIERYHELFEQFVLGHQKRNLEFRQRLEGGVIPYFGDITYPAPQYPIDSITFILTDESYDLFEVGLYIPLTGYVNAFERLMYVEEKLVHLSEQYQPLPPESHSEYQYQRSIQLQHAQRYLRYLDIRKSICEELVERSEELSQLLAQQS